MRRINPKADAFMILVVVVGLVGAFLSQGCSNTLEPYGRGREVGVVYHFVEEPPTPGFEDRDLGWGQIDSDNHFIRNWIRYLVTGLGGVGTYLVGDSNDWWSSSGGSTAPAPIVSQPGEETAEATGGGSIELRGVGTCPDHVRAHGPDSLVFCEERLP